MLLPARFGKFILLKELEVGGMAGVYLAKSQGIAGFEKFLAIKKIFPQLSRSSDFVEMFVTEARIAAELNHPNISHIYDLGSLDGEYFIAMEYIHGKDAYRLIKRCQSQGRRISPAIASYITLQVLDGLGYAHRKKDLAGTPMRIVHRDISPRNVLLSYEGNVKIIDFGIAKAATLDSNTRVGTIKGKVNYMSPEQARGEDLDGRSDLFAVGLLLYELLHLTKLFSGGSEIRTLDLIRECRIPDLRQQNPELPEALAQILIRALAREREDRFQTAEDFSAELLWYLQSHSTRLSAAELSTFMQECFTAEIRAEQRELDHYRQVSLEPGEGAEVYVVRSRTAGAGADSTAKDSRTKEHTGDKVTFPPNFVLEDTKVQPLDDLALEPVDGATPSPESHGRPAGIAVPPGTGKSGIEPVSETPHETLQATIQGSGSRDGSTAAMPAVTAPISVPGGRKRPGTLLAAGLGATGVLLGAGGWWLLSPSSTDVGGPGELADRSAELNVVAQPDPAGADSVVAVGTSPTDPHNLTPVPAQAPGADHAGVEPSGTNPVQAEGSPLAQIPSTTSAARAAMADGGPTPPSGPRATPDTMVPKPTSNAEPTGISVRTPELLVTPRPAVREAEVSRATPRTGAPAGHATSVSPVPQSDIRPVTSGSPQPSTSAAEAPGEVPGASRTAQAAASTSASDRQAVEAYGYLSVNAAFPAIVRIDGTPYGQTPVKRIRVPVGTRKVELERISDNAIKVFEIQVLSQQVQPVIWRGGE